MSREINSIAVIGDSLSKGVVFSEEKQRYIFYGKCYVNEITKAVNVPVHNLSKFGSNILYGRRTFEAKKEKLAPDVVLIEYGGNDCDFKWDEVAENPYLDHQPQIPPKQFESELLSLVNTVKESGITPVLMNLPPLNDRAYFEWFTGGSREKGDSILIWLKAVREIYNWQEGYSKIIESIAAQTKTRLIDVRSAFLARENYTEFICLDGIHPNEQGQKLMEDVVREYIAQNAPYLLA